MDIIQEFNGVIITNGLIDYKDIQTKSILTNIAQVTDTAEVNEMVPYGMAFTLNGDSYTITNYTAPSIHLKIPRSYKFKKVTEIGADVFSRKSIVSVDIPETILNIGEGAFSGCDYLKEIKLPSSIQQIGNNAFAGSGLTTVTIDATEVPVTGTTAFPTGVTFYVPYTALSAYTTAWGSYGTVKAQEFNGIAEKAKTADTAASTANATNATNATYAQYASTDTSKGTIEERLTNLGFKQGSVSLINSMLATKNILKRQGSFVIGDLNLAGDLNYGEHIAGKNFIIGTVPTEFIPSEMVIVCANYVMRVTPNVQINANQKIACPLLVGQLLENGNLTLYATSEDDTNIQYKYGSVSLKFAYEVSPK